MTRWTTEESWQWAKKHPWFFGANFTPSTAINQLEMWQEDTFDPETIDRELGYAQSLGMNIMRVYLHDLLWEHDKKGFIKRIHHYLSMAEKRGIKTMLTIFDDCWHGPPKLGPQPEPKPFTHNSGWLQSPGHSVVEDPHQWPRLERYVKELLETFKDDPRIAIWDLYNEPGNGEDGDDGRSDREGGSLDLVEAVFKWAREVKGVTQPLTVGYWGLEEAMNELVVKLSDVISFHSYKSPEKGFVESIATAKEFGRPVICSEYLARGFGCTFERNLPLLKQAGFGAINWGLVAGKTQTHFPWGWSPEKGQPSAYHHDIFHPDGSLLHPEEKELIGKVLSS